MFGVKLVAERRDAATHDGLAAPAAQRALPGVEVEGAERPSFQLHEDAIGKGLQTVLVIKKKNSNNKNAL